MKFRNKRLDTAAKGKQAPLLVDCPWLYSKINKKNLIFNYSNLKQ